MPRRPIAVVRLAAALVGLVAVAACDPAIPALPESNATPVSVSVGSSTSTSTTTTVPPNRQPRLAGPPEARAAVGAPGSVAFTVGDPDGDAVAVSVQGDAPGLALDRTAGGAVLRWRPTTPGTWPVTVVAEDARGGRTTRSVDLLARFPAHPEFIVAMGDSVASGHGLQRRDYLGRDRCFRSEGEAYPARLLEQLVAAGRWPAGGAVALVACSGARVADLRTEPVSGAPEEWAPDGAGDLSQLDWAVRGNPGLVTLTIGANDLGFSQPWELIDGAVLDVAAVDARLEPLAAELEELLARLVAETDATVVVTTYYDPSAANPQGVDGCRTTCFTAAVGVALDRFNAVIAGAVGAVGSPRVRLADLRSAFLGHGAPNGLGPDAVRSGGWGLIGDLVGPLTSGTHPYCARGDTAGEPWINSLDCVHPDGRGAREIAALVAAAL